MNLPKYVFSKTAPVAPVVWPGVLSVGLALFSCNNAPVPPPLGSNDLNDLVLETRIAASSDDAEEGGSGATNRSSLDLELVFNGTNQTVGLRFAGVALPPGVIVTEAYVQFKAAKTGSEPTSLTVQGQASDDAPTFGSGSFNVSTRPRTAAAVAWVPPAWAAVGEVGLAQRTPDLKSVIQELIDRPGWRSGQALALVVSGTGKRVARSFDGDAAGAPLLRVAYKLDTSVDIAAFTASPDALRPNHQAVFSWSVTDAENSPLSCTLDIESDGLPEYTVADCQNTTSQTHLYTAVGDYTATLTASDGTGAVATALATVTVGYPTVTTLEQRIASSADDAEESATGSVSRTSPDLELIQDATAQTVGLRFPALTIPRGVRITGAYVQFKVDERTSEATALTIRGQAADHASTFGTSGFDISSRGLTTASVNWSPGAWGVASEAALAQRTPDLSSVLQEVIDRPGWAPGNALALTLTGSGKRVAKAFDSDPAGAPLLHVSYSFDDSVTIDAFAVDPVAAELGQNVTFSWSVGDADGDPLTCTLDADGDGVADYTLPGCAGSGSQTHGYALAGSYTAHLRATDSTGAVAEAGLPVSVTTADSVTVAAAGDIACDPDNVKFGGGHGTELYCHMKATSDLLLALDPDAVLALGDNQYENATLDQYLRSYDLSWGRLKAVTTPVVGNHEYITPGAAGHYGYFGPAAGDPAKGYYSYDLGTWHLIALNSNCSKVGGCGAGSPQERWLRADLAAHPNRCTLAFWHHPRFSSGAIGGSTPTTAFWQALYDFDAEVVLAGHDHNYERFAPQTPGGVADPVRGIREFVVGTGGKNYTSIGVVQPNSEVRRSGTYGVLSLTLHPEGYEWAFLAEPGGNFTDTGSTACH